MTTNKEKIKEAKSELKLTEEQIKNQFKITYSTKNMIVANNEEKEITFYKFKETEPYRKITTKYLK